MRQTAKQFLRAQLANGPRPREEIKQAAEQAGLAFSTVAAAKAELGAISNLGARTWDLPHDPPSPRQLGYIDTLVKTTGHPGPPTARTWMEASDQIALLRERPTIRQLDYIDALTSGAWWPVTTRTEAKAVLDWLVRVRNEERRDRERLKQEQQPSDDLWAAFYAAPPPPDEPGRLDPDGPTTEEKP